MIELFIHDFNDKKLIYIMYYKKLNWISFKVWFGFENFKLDIKSSWSIEISKK